MTEPHSLQSTILGGAGFRHAFFTRNGGASAGAYESLSFSVGVGDEAENVRENFARAARALHVAPERVYCAAQVHGAGAVAIDGLQSPEEVLARTADAVVSAAADTACGVRIADCVPLLVAGRRSGAVAAIHAGWRGTVAGVVESGVCALRALCDGDALVAAIGPHISGAVFEVSDDVAALLAACSPDPSVVDRTRGPKPFVDLRRIVRAKLRALGLGDADIDDVPGCTVREPERFFSYRRDGARSGRHLAAIVVRRTTLKGIPASFA